MTGAGGGATASAGRKRKVECGGEFSYSTSFVRLRSRRGRVAVTPENWAENAAASDSNDQCASCCSSNGSSEMDNNTSKFLDLEEAEEESAEIATSSYELENCRERREATPSSEVQADSGEMESKAVKPSSSGANSSCHLSTDKKMPSKSELELFFAAARKQHLQELQAFAQKYNFDFEKEEPLEGRYEWVRVNQP